MTSGYDPDELRVRLMRAVQTYNASNVSAAIGVSRKTVWAWETGKHVPTPMHRMVIHQALEILEEHGERVGNVTNVTRGAGQE